jgi:replication-associated recombination protein RarA
LARSNAPAIKYGVYDGYEVRSALRKEIKLGNLDAAISWANVMISQGGTEGRTNLVKQMFIMATEDCYGDAVFLRAAMTLQVQNKVGETDCLYFLVAAMCRAEKWWESDEGRAVDLAWARAIGDYEAPERRREIPSYALDRHWRWFKGLLGAKGAGNEPNDPDSGADVPLTEDPCLFDAAEVGGEPEPGR